jgi:hypothetical protein
MSKNDLFWVRVLCIALLAAVFFPAGVIAFIVEHRRYRENSIWSSLTNTLRQAWRKDNAQC